MLQCSINSGAQHRSTSAKRSHPWISSLPGVCGGDDGKRSESHRADLGTGRLQGGCRLFLGDGSATWNYTAALVAFRRDGDGAASRERLARALKSNPHVPAYLLNRVQFEKHGF
jgi:hypothetical protein